MQLSTSALNVFADCKRCFYLDRRMKAPRPRGIFPSLPGGVDAVVKDVLNAYRGQLHSKFSGLEGWVLFRDPAKLECIRQWNSREALKYRPGTVDFQGKENILVGGLDEILENEAGDLFAPLDYKTKGSEREDGACPAYYQRQLDLYALLLSTKYDVADFGALLDFWPVPCEKGIVKFDCKITLADVSVERGRELFEAGISCLESDELPEASPTCEYCKTHATRSEALKKCLIA